MQRRTACRAISSTSSGALRSWFSIWIGEEETKVWMRGLLGVAHRLPGGVDVDELHPRQPGDGDPLALAGDALHRGQVAGRGGRVAGLDDVHAQPHQLPGDLDLLVLAHRRAGRLFAVAQGRVEYQDLLAHRFTPGSRSLVHRQDDGCRDWPRTAGRAKDEPSPRRAQAGRRDAVSLCQPATHRRTPSRIEQAPENTKPAPKGTGNRTHPAVPPSLAGQPRLTQHAVTGGPGSG